MQGTIETRNGILEVAKVQFLTYGLTRVTMDEIAREVGISKKTVYVNFSSKNELVDAVLKRQLLRGLRQYKEIVNSSDAYIAKLQNILRLIGETLARMSYRFQTDLRKFRPLLWKRMEQVRAETIVVNFSEFVREGIGLGLIRPDIHPEVFLTAYLNALQGTTRPEVLEHHSFSFEVAVKTIVDVMMNGILTETGRKQFSQHSITISSTRTTI